MALISNWLDSDELEIEPALYRGDPMVRLLQSGGSMRFQFDMTPNGARTAAAKLIATADAADLLSAAGVTPMDGEMAA